MKKQVGERAKNGKILAILGDDDGSNEISAQIAGLIHEEDNVEPHNSSMLMRQTIMMVSLWFSVELKQNKLKQRRQTMIMMDSKDLMMIRIMMELKDQMMMSCQL